MEEHLPTLHAGNREASNLWQRGYESLKIREKELVAAYEQEVVPSSSAHSNSASPMSCSLNEDLVKQKLKDRESKQLVLSIAKASQVS